MILLFAGILAGLVSLAPASAPVTDTTLDNGMRVIVIPNRLAPVVTTSLMYGVGSNDDTIPGIAHATEHMLFRGTTDLTSDQFATVATRIGAEYNAETANTYTRYFFTVPSSYVDVVLRIEADRMQHAAMQQADWQLERGAIEQEVKAHQANPLAKVVAEANHAFYGDTPWANDGVGTLAGFEKMQAADIAAFYRTWYRPNNAMLVVAGDVDPNAVVASAKTYFAAIPRGDLPGHPALPTETVQKRSLVESVDFPVPLAIRLFRLPGSDDPDYAAEQTLFSIFQSKRSAFSDLMLSGKDLFAIAIASAYPQGGSGMLMAAARPGSDPAVSLADLSGVVKGYVTGGVPAADVDVAKARELASRAYEGASIPGEAQLWAIAAGISKTTPERLYNSIGGVTSADVLRVLKTYVDTDNAISVVLTPKPNASLPTLTGANQKEDVQVKSTADVALPAWTNAYFSAPLQAPHDDVPSSVYHLKNGMTLVVRPESSSPTVVVQGDVEMNPDLHEAAGKEGTAALTAALIPLGTTEHDVKAYQSELDAIAADVTLGPNFTAEARSNDFDTLVAILAEGLLHPALSADRFATVSANSVSSLRAFENRPEYKAQLAKMAAMYAPNDPHRRHPTSGSEARVTLDDVRAWYRYAYRPDVTTVAVVGDVDPAHVRDVFERAFGSWKATGPRPTLNYPPPKVPRAGRSTTIASSTATQAEVTLSQHVNVRRGQRDVVALQLANTMLSGEGTASMLFRDVRKQHGYVYSIDSSLDVGQNGSTFDVNFASDPKNAPAAQRTAMATIERLRRFPPSASELALAKATTLSRYFVSLDSYGSLARELLFAAQTGIDSNDVSRYYAQVLAITPADVQRAMATWIDPQKFARVIVEPEAAIK